METFSGPYFVLFVNVILRVCTSGRKFNTFSTVFMRYTPYNPRVINKVCFLKPDRGPCRGNIDMYYYSPASKSCDIFKWGGCQGNGNRFSTSSECQKFCLSPPNEDRTRPKFCSHSFDYGFCFGAVNRYYYDFQWKICKKAIYSGCGGNRNNFETEAMCEQECRLGKFRTRPTTTSDRMKKVLIINAQHATSRKSRIQVTTKASATTVAPVEAS